MRTTPNKHFLVFVLIGALSLLSTGCVTQTTATKQELFPRAYGEKPLSILVLPAINQSTGANAGNYYAATIAPPLANQGYYVAPIPLTDELLQVSGIVDGAQLVNVPAQRFGALFGVDSVLYVTIRSWDTNYYVIGGNVTVGLDFLLKSTKTEEALWEYSDTVVVDTSGSGQSGLIGALIETAINTAVQDYLPVAQMVNNRSVTSMPVGAYHPRVGTDGMDKVVVPVKQDANVKPKSQSKGR